MGCVHVGLGGGLGLCVRDAGAKIGEINSINLVRNKMIFYSVTQYIIVFSIVIP